MLDARDPLRYRSEDLESYSVALHPTKGSVLLLNKADLLPAALRSAWADYFEEQGVEYVFWSAKAGIDSLTAPGESCSVHRTYASSFSLELCHPWSHPIVMLAVPLGPVCWRLHSGKPCLFLCCWYGYSSTLSVYMCSHWKHAVMYKWVCWLFIPTAEAVECSQGLS